ncbi:MAG: acyltransferase [Deltaproteobacteria bacterium]|nr:MAG: acyltransferase [Deltaproteobacteria bacterium]
MRASRPRPPRLPVSALRAPHRLDIQGLRGVAVLLVVLFHAGVLLPGGFIGVDVFFVLSGFVVTAMLQREVVRTGGVDVRRFFLRRIRRLMPAQALMVTAVLGATILVLSPDGEQQAAAQTALAATLLAANVALGMRGDDYFGPTAEQNPFLHLWSLSVEEQFYLVLPWVFVVPIAWVARGAPAGEGQTLCCSK